MLQLYVGDTELYLVAGYPLLPKGTKYFSKNGGLIVPTTEGFKNIISSFCSGPFNNNNFIPQNTTEV